MKILVYGAGVLGSIMALRLHQGGQDVSLLARGQRLADLREHGIVLIDDETNTKQTCHVNLVESLEPEDAYDLVLVIMRKNQVADILPILAANQHTPTVAFMGNNALGPDAYAAAIGRERVLMGFVGAGGGRDGHIIRHIRGTEANPATIVIGEIDGKITPRLESIAIVFEASHLKVELSPNVDAWLKTHLALVSPVADALIAANGDNYRLAHTRDGLILMVRAIRESFDALRELEIPVLPRSLALMARLPEPILIPLLARFMNTRSAELVMARHANAADDEMRTIAQELRTLVNHSGIATPHLDRLEAYLDHDRPRMEEGSRNISLNWLGTLWGLMLSGLITLPLMRRVRKAV